MLGMTDNYSLQPGDYFVRRLANGEAHDPNKVYIKVPYDLWPQPGQSMIFEVLNPETHDHVYDDIIQRIVTGTDKQYVCKVCGMILSQDQYIILGTRKRLSEWLEESYTSFLNDSLPLDGTSYADELMRHLRGQLGEF